MRWLAWLLWLGLVAPAEAQTWHPGTAANVAFAAYIGAPGSLCGNGAGYAAKVGRWPDYWVYYGITAGSKASFQSGFSGNATAFKTAGCNQNLVVKMPMIVNDVGTGVYMTFKAVGAGTYDTDYWTYAATQVKNAGYTNPVFIIGWEMNNGYPWQDNIVVLDGGSGTGLMAQLTINGAGHVTAATVVSNEGGKNYLNTDTGLTPDDGTCSPAPTFSVSTVNGSGSVASNGLTITAQGTCTTRPGPGNWIAAFRDISAAIKAVLPNALVGFDPNCGLGVNGWSQDYPGDDVVDIVGIDCYDYFTSTNVISAGTTLANGAVSVATQPRTINPLHLMVVAGSGAVTAGTVTVAYNKQPSGTQSDVFTLPALAAGAEYDAYTSLPTNHVNSVTVASLANTGTAPKASLVSDQPPERWSNTLNQQYGLAAVTTAAAATSNAYCGQSPSNCLATLDISTHLGGAKKAAVFESGSYNGPNSGVLNAGVYGNDDCYWGDQMFQYLGANGYFMYLAFEAVPAPTFGTKLGYTLPYFAAMTTQDLAP